MKLLSSRVFVLLLLSTQRVPSSLIARESNVSTPAGNQLFDIDEFDESSTWSKSDHTPSKSQDLSSEQTPTLTNSFHDWKNSAIIDALPDVVTWSSDERSGGWIEDLTTQIVTTSDVGEYMTSLNSINQNSTSYKDRNPNVSRTDATPTTEDSEMSTYPTTVKNSAMEFDESASGHDVSTHVSTAVLTADFDSITMTSMTNNLIVDSSTLPDSATNDENDWSSSNATHMVENSTATTSGEENRVDELFSVSTLLLMTVGIVNLVLNVLNIIIYSQRKTPSAAYIIMLGAVDVVDCLMFLVFSLLELTSSIFPTVNIRTNSLFLLVFNNAILYLKQLSRTLNTLISADRFFVIYKIWKTKNRFQKYPKTMTGIVAFVMLICIALQAATVNPSSDGSSQSPTCQGVSEENSNMTTVDSNKNNSLNQNTENIGPALEITTPEVTSTSEGTDIFFVIIIFFNVIYTFIMYITIAVFNIAALVSLRKHAQERKRLNLSMTRTDSNAQDRKQSVILLTMTTVYLLLSLPDALLMSVNVLKFSQEDKMCPSTVFIRIVTVAGFVTSSSDFVVFLVMSKSFREKLVALFVCCARSGSKT